MMKIEAYTRPVGATYGPYSRLAPGPIIHFRLSGEWFWRRCGVEEWADIRRQYED